MTEDRQANGRGAAALRWSGAAILTVLAHGILGWWVVTHALAPAEVPDAPQGITIDLEPVAVSQNAPNTSATMASGATPTPQSAAAPVADMPPAPPEPEPAKATPPTPDPPPAADPPPTQDPPPAADPPPTADPPPAPAAAPPAPMPEPPMATPAPPAPPDPVTPPPEIPLPPIPPTISPPVAELPPAPVPAPVPMVAPAPQPLTETVPAPAPAPRPPPKLKPAPPKPDPLQVARATAARRAAAARREQQRQSRADARARLRADEAAVPRESGGASNQSQAASSVSSGSSLSTWRGEVMARLNAVKPSAPDGATGTTRVTFSVDRSGRVTSASVTESSGDGGLDGAAVAMVRRASPLPAPPADLGGRVSLSVPVRFR